VFTTKLFENIEEKKLKRDVAQFLGISNRKIFTSSL